MSKLYLNSFGDNVTQFHVSLCHFLVQDMINKLLQLPVMILYIWDHILDLRIQVRFQFQFKLVLICKVKIQINPQIYKLMNVINPLLLLLLC